MSVRGMMRSTRPLTFLVILLIFAAWLLLYQHHSLLTQDLPKQPIWVASSSRNITRLTETNHLRIKSDYGSVFHEYENRVTLRIIVMTYNRPESLQRCLDSMADLVIDGYSVAMDIWIDQSKSGQVDMKTVRVATSYHWRHGPVTVWIHGRHVGLYGQWINTWRPVMRNGKATDEELALFVEDDVDISPYAFRWLRHLNKVYFNRTDIACYGLQDNNALVSQGKRKFLNGPKSDTVFLYGIPGTWGMAPHPARWAEFQDWYEIQKNISNFHPYVPKAAVHTSWYKHFEKRNRQDTMWTMWFIYFLNKFDLFAIYSNIPTYSSSPNSSLTSNRREAGMHFPDKIQDASLIPKLMVHWNESYVNFPKKPVTYGFDGKVMKRT